jgi:D-aminopeptidase
MRNLLTDVSGIKVGHGTDLRLGSGSTVVVFDEPAVASIDIRGGGPGTRESALLDPAQTVEGIDAIVLSGGSAFGLDAASGAQAWLREQGRGFAGTGATTVNYKGGIGSASAQTPDGHTVGALAAVNAVGSVVVDRGPWFWAAPFEQNGEFGGRGFPAALPSSALAPRTKGTPLASTTLVIVATDAALDKAQAKRLAIMAQTGLSRAIYPVHTPLDGDVVFAASTRRRPLGEAHLGLISLGTVAANVVARAIARGVFAATALPLPGAMRSWTDEFGR